MRRFPVVLVVLLLLATGGRASLAQVATPEAGTGAGEDLRGVAPQALTGALRAEFESYVADQLRALEVPGASVAVIQGGEIVYAQGFGVRERGGADPVTPDTLMMIGSVTKSMTSLLAATLVDDGWLGWDTPLVQLLPDFAVADPELTPRLTVADAFCACTGLPQRDAEIVFNFDALTPEGLIAQTAEIPLTAPYGEQYQYSNQLYAVGGYAAARAAGAAPNDLRGGYEAALRERVLNPIGMTRSTFALEDVLRDGDYGLPHAANLAGETRPFPLLTDEGFVTSVAPAGALWSSAREMARYIQFELADGVAPGGARVVSAENLAHTRAPRVDMPVSPGTPPLFADAARAYAMGWAVGVYQGQPLLSHSGGTFGFVSEVAFLPEADLGVVILTNGGAGAPFFAYAVQFRLFELLFDQSAAFDSLLSEFLAAQEAQLAQFQAQLQPVDPADVAPYLGRYTNPVLGDVTLTMQGDRLIFDAGEVRSELQAMRDEAGNVAGYIFLDPPLASPLPLTLQRDAAGRPELVAPGPATELPTTYEFTFLEPIGAATPVATPVATG